MATGVGVSLAKGLEMLHPARRTAERMTTERKRTDFFILMDPWKSNFSDWILGIGY
jgi:hypothetical protein